MDGQSDTSNYPTVNIYDDRINIFFDEHYDGDVFIY